MKPPSTYTALRTRPALPGFSVRMYEVLAAQAFHPCLPNQETSAGWTRVDDPAVTDLLTGWLSEPWVVLGYREDTKTVPPVVLRMELERVIAERKLKPSRSERKDLEDVVRKSLLERALPTTVHTPVYWHTVRGELYIGATGARADVVALAWQRLLAAVEGVEVSHEHVPRRLGPASWIYQGPEDLPACSALTETDVVDEGEWVNGALAPEEGGRFLAWLWHQSETARDGIRAIDVDGSKLGWIVQDGLSLSDRETGKPRTSIRAIDAQEDPALRVSILAGHPVRSVGLHVEANEVYAFEGQLAVKDGHLVVSGLKFPKSAGDPLVQAAGHACDIAGVHGAMLALLRHYGVRRANPDWWGQYQGTFRRWLEGEIREWAGEEGVDLGDSQMELLLALRAELAERGEVAP